MKPQILVCGEALIDLVPQHVDNTIYHQAVPGGSPFNVAIGLGRLGAAVAYLGRLSHDPNGIKQLQHLQSSQVSDDFIQRGTEPSALAFVFPPDADGQDVRYSFYFTGTTEVSLAEADIPTPLPTHISHLHFGSVSTLLEPHASIFRRIRERERSRCSISFDPNVRPSITPDKVLVKQQIEQIISEVDMIKASDADLAWLYPEQPTDEIAQHWLQQGAKLVIITRGARGATAYLGQAQISVPGHQIQVADTVGAGDSFLSTLLFALQQQQVLNNASLSSLSTNLLQDVLRQACAAAALTCTRVGANPPSHEELQAFLA